MKFPLKIDGAHILNAPTPVVFTPYFGEKIALFWPLGPRMAPFLVTRMMTDEAGAAANRTMV